MMIQRKTIRGFTLIEGAISLVILGMLTATLLGLFTRAEEQRRLQTTHDHMEEIVQALAIYVETASRLPCPANPGQADLLFGWEYGVAATLNRPQGTCQATPAQWQGIVPFQTLGLSHNVVKDGWGRYFSYAVSPVFVQPNDFTAMASDLGQPIHERCRNLAWVQEGEDGATPPSTVIDNLNAAKARFCCAGGGHVAPFLLATDLDIRLHTDSGTDIFPTRDTDMVRYDNIDVPHQTGAAENPPSRSLVSTFNMTAPAFVLISHGENGLGAYLGNNTLNRFEAAVTAEEVENTDIDRLYFIGQQDNNFDDITVWMTQDGIMAASGTSSCQYP